VLAVLVPSAIPGVISRGATKGRAALVAVIVTGVLLVTLGAVKNPLLEIVPALADQVTAVSAVPLMLAVNCCCVCDGMLVLLGDSDIEELVEAPGELGLCEAEPHAMVKPVRQSKSERTRKLGIEFLSQ
jgi:hypothetical protein